MAEPLDPNSILREAQLVNNDLGRHSVKCSFSARLSGRFYQNCSLEKHTMRRSRISEMQAKRKRLEKELSLEKHRVRLLGQRLVEMENAREVALDMIFTIKRGVLGLQSLVRRRQAMKLLALMKHRILMTENVSLFFQSRYRGWRGRLRAASIRQYMRLQLMNKCATVIQTTIRCHSQRKFYHGLLLERKILRERYVVSIQAVLRGQRMQKLYRREMKQRHKAALDLQRALRGMMGRLVAEKVRQEHEIRVRAEAEKPKRVPLHMRRYSTYSVNANANAESQHQLSSKGPTKRNSMLTRRRGSIDLTKTSKSFFYPFCPKSVDADENDSVATSITSLTNHTEISSRSRYQRPPSLKRLSTYCDDRIQSVSRTPNRERRKSSRSFATGDILKNDEGLDSGRKESSTFQSQFSRSVTSIDVTDEDQLKVLRGATQKQDVINIEPLTANEAVSVVMEDMLAEIAISHNIKSALFAAAANDKEADCGETEDDLTFLLLNNESIT